MTSILPTILKHINQQTPLIIGVNGSVGVGKSFFAGQLKSLIEAHVAPNLKIVTVSTDGFLLPNDIVEDIKKGFPESYNFVAMNDFLQRVKSRQPASAPVYSHIKYDIIPGEYIDATNADVLIIEGLCALHKNIRKHIDLSIFIDADEKVLLNWFIERAVKNRENAKNDPTSYFVQFLPLTDEEYRAVAIKIWNNTNRPNLYENILPDKQFANIIIKKDKKHNMQAYQSLK